MLILALNVGSSSLKAAVFDLSAGTEQRIFAATVAGRGAQLVAAFSSVRDGAGEEPVAGAGTGAAVAWLIARLERDGLADQLTVVGHRLVHGGLRYREPVWLTPEVLADLESLIPLAPDHLPVELGAVRQVAARWPRIRSAGSFDAAFHADMPGRARLFGIPRQFTDEGVVRFGFHGLSYEYIVGELRAASLLARRLVVAHLGSGASLAAILGGQSVDTTMGFTPAGGVIMATRSGDLDPGVLLYLARAHNLDADGLSRVVNVDGGLRGLSTTTGDIRVLLESSASNPRAAAAVEIFCYQVSKAIASLAVALRGLDLIVFTAGIGEHAAPIRAMVCDRLTWCGVSLDDGRNRADAPVISTTASQVTVRIMPTNEELMVARHARTLLDRGGQGGPT